MLLYTKMGNTYATSSPQEDSNFDLDAPIVDDSPSDVLEDEAHLRSSCQSANVDVSTLEKDIINKLESYVLHDVNYQFTTLKEIYTTLLFINKVQKSDRYPILSRYTDKLLSLKSTLKAKKNDSLLFMELASAKLKAMQTDAVNNATESLNTMCNNEKLQEEIEQKARLVEIYNSISKEGYFIESIQPHTPAGLVQLNKYIDTVSTLLVSDDWYNYFCNVVFPDGKTMTDDEIKSKLVELNGTLKAKLPYSRIRIQILESQNTNTPDNNLQQ